LDKGKNQCIREKTGAQNIVKEIKQYQKKIVVLIILIITEIDVTTPYCRCHSDMHDDIRLHYGPAVTSQLFWLVPQSDEILDVVTSKVATTRTEDGHKQNTKASATV
jgi:hypothetical protein